MKRVIAKVSAAGRKQAKRKADEPKNNTPRSRLVAEAEFLEASLDPELPDRDVTERYALHALSSGFQYWSELNSNFGEDGVGAAAVADILFALLLVVSSGDFAELMEKGGPHDWARGYLKRRKRPMHLPEQKLAARWFVSLIERDLVRYPDLISPERKELFASRALSWLYTSGLSKHVAPNERIEERLKSVADELARVGRRKTQTPKAFAAAVLRGVGLDKERVDSILQKLER